MANDDVEKIKERLPIVEVVRSYVKLNKAGRSYKGKSPFSNERTPSFFVSPEKNLFHCFSSGKGGDIFTFIQEVEGVDFPTALKMLAEKAGVTLQKADPKQQSERTKLYELLEYATKLYEVAFRKDTEAVQYMLDRGVTKDTMKTFRIGYAPAGWDYVTSRLKQKGYSDQLIEKSGLGVPGKRGVYDRFRERIMFPIADSQGRVVAFSGRIFVKPGSDTDPKATGKYVNSPETPLYHKSRILYGYDHAKRSMMTQDQCVVVEGQMDLIMSHQAGIQQSVALSGTALTDEQIKLIARFTDRIVLALDADDAGFAAATRSVILAYQAGMHVRVLPLGDQKDPADLIKEDPASWPALIEQASDFVTFFLDRLKRQEQDAHGNTKMIHEQLYPVVRVMGALAQEEAHKKVAHFLDVRVDAARDDFTSWERNQDPLQTPHQPVTPKEQTKTPEKNPIERELMSVLLWLEQGNEHKIDVEMYKKRYRDIAGEAADELWQLGQKDASSLIFQAELRYDALTRDDIVREVEQLLTSALVRSLEQQQRDLMARLRQAERQGDEAAATNYLTEYQAITQKIEDITQQQSSS